MQAGQFDQRLAIDAPVRTDDTAGGAVKSWDEIDEVWAQVLPLGARDQFAAGQPEGVASFRVWIRPRSDLTIDHRFRWVTNGGLVMNIRGVPHPGPRADRMELLCDSGMVGDG